MRTVEVDVLQNLFNTQYGRVVQEHDDGTVTVFLLEDEQEITVKWDANRAPYGVYVPVHR